MAMPIPPSHDSGIKKKVAIPAAQKKDYREAFKVVTTGKKRKKEEMFTAFPAATALYSCCPQQEARSMVIASLQRRY